MADPATETRCTEAVATWAEEEVVGSMKKRLMELICATVTLQGMSSLRQIILSHHTNWYQRN